MIWLLDPILDVHSILDLEQCLTCELESNTRPVEFDFLLPGTVSIEDLDGLTLSKILGDPLILELLFVEG